MSTYRLKDFVDPIAITVQDPANSGFERFVGLEHYDSNELVIKRFSGVELLTTNAKAFQKNDLLIARRNVYLRRAGVVYFDGITSGDSIVLRVKEDCEKQTGISRELAQRVLPLVLNTDRFWIYANKHADGMNSKRISKDTLLDYEFDLPSIEEQKVLADKLWAAYKVKESYRQLLSTTDEMLKAKFQEMFGDAEKNGTISDLVENNIASVKKTYKNEDTIAYIDISSVSAESNKVLDVTNYVVKQAPSRAQQCVRKGDILVSTTRPLNRNIAVVESDASNLVASTGFCVLRPKNGWSDYVMAIVKSDEYTEAMCDKATGGVYPAVNNSDVLSYNINIPSPEILQQISLIFRQAEATKTSLRASIEAIDRVIRSLINQ